MFSFEDRGGEQLTLRPEVTAGVARAFISGGLAQHLPLKFFCQGPMFRYERPQKGRQRQFHQIDVELLGVDGPLADIEIISLAAHILDALGVADKVTLELNTLGDTESRQSYRTKLVGYLEGFKDKLSEDSLARLDRNPLRILDSKDQGDRAVIADAPLLEDHMNDASKAFFEDVQKGLKTAGIEYKINPTLVRGLDYYCHMAFEFTTETLGAQGAVLAGGRYDGLIEAMGGPPTPGTGWAAGVERLALMIAEPPGPARPVAVVPIGQAAEAEALSLVQRLRRAGFTADLGFSGNLQKRLKGANKANAVAAVIIGEDELAKGAATVRDMETGEQTEVKLSALEDHLARYR
jgi:histidyl-tRNA synthetase